MQNILEDTRTGDENYKDGRENTLVRDIHSDLDVTFWKDRFKQLTGELLQAFKKKNFFEV